MKKTAIILSGLLFLSCAHGQTAPDYIPPNISIEVEFKETGRKVSGIKGLERIYSKDMSSYTKQHIVVSDGLTAVLRVGQDVPFVNFYRTYLYRRGYIETMDIAFKEVGTSLTVTPKIRGGLIEIELTPRISCITNEYTKAIDIKELSTTVMAPDGQSISIGGLIGDEEFSGIFFKSGESSNLEIILTPRIMR